VTAAVLNHVGVTEIPAGGRPEAGDAVGVDDAQGVVHLRERPHLGQVVPGDPDDDSADGAHVNGTRPLTQPAHGVMPTRPQIMPLTPPRKVGFFSLESQASMAIQTRTPSPWRGSC